MLVRPGAQHPCRWRGSGRQLGSERGHDHRRIQAGGQGRRGSGHRRHAQRGRQPSGARDRHGKGHGSGGHHALGGAGPAEQEPNPGAGRQSLRLAVLRGPRSGCGNGRCLDNLDRFQRRSDRQGGDSAGHRLPTRPWAWQSRWWWQSRPPWERATASWCGTGWPWKRPATSTPSFSTRQAP